MFRRQDRKKTQNKTKQNKKPEMKPTPYSLPKPIDSHRFKNVLFELFSLLLSLFFFYKMIKFHKDICFA